MDGVVVVSGALEGAASVTDDCLGLSWRCFLSAGFASANFGAASAGADAAGAVAPLGGVEPVSGVPANTGAASAPASSAAVRAEVKRFIGFSCSFCGLYGLCRGRQNKESAICVPRIAGSKMLNFGGKRFASGGLL
jgi:hypothetical protein